MTEGLNNNPVTNNELSPSSWTERENAKLKALLGVPEIVSLEPVSVPHSSLYGIKIKLEQGSNAGPRQIFGPLFKGPLNKNRICQAFPQCSFLSFDGVAPDNKLSRGELFSSRNFQPPHQDSLAPSFIALYHPPLTEDKTVSRMAPTMLTAAYNYRFFYYQYYANKLEKIVKNKLENVPLIPEQVGNRLLELHMLIESSETPSAEHLKEFYDALNYFIELVLPIPDSDYKIFLEEKAYAYNWQPNQMLIFDEEFLYHSRGAIPNDEQSIRNLKNEQGLIIFGRPF